jgi:transcriptional regulator GlxA family with amidase domain
MKIAIVTLDGFNEIDSIVAAHILNRVPGWSAQITSPTKTVTSMNGLHLAAQQPLSFTCEADGVIVGSGRKTAEMIQDEELMNSLKLDPGRQYIGSQCSGALILIRLGIVQNVPVCTDSKTKPSVEAKGFTVPDAPLHACGRVATAGGCLASQYLAAWMIWTMAGKLALIDALSYVLPRGEEDKYLTQIIMVVEPFISAANGMAAE